jgi:GAF domain-containing protein
MSDVSTAKQTEDRRQQVISEYQLAKINAEPVFDAVTELAADLFGVPISAVTVLGRDRQLLPGVCGLEQRSTARADAFCNVTVESNEVLIVEDALADARFRFNPLVIGEPHIRFYAGAPIRIGGTAIGSLCIIDRKPRQLNEVDRRRLALITRTVVDLMELRLAGYRHH